MDIVTIDEIKDTLISFFKSKSLLPIFGAGFSCGCTTLNNGKVPSGSDYKKHMLDTTFKYSGLTDSEKNIILGYSFSNMCNFYEDDENISPNIRKKYIKTNFFKTVFEDDDPRKNILKIDWPYIYTLNIDDAIENNSDYNHVILPNRSVDEDIFNTEKCVIKLHGDISDILTYNDGSKTFTTREYVSSLVDNSVLLQKLKNDYNYQNILFIGCSLDDEIDLMSISNIHSKIEGSNNFNRRIIFVKDKPSKIKLSDYRQFGITDIVYFDSYDLMYKELLEIWLKSKKVTSSEISNYCNFDVKKIGHCQEENKSYFFYGKSLINSSKRTINIPFYFIERETTKRLFNNLKRNTVHILRGNRFSGKSYFMTSIYLSINDREIYFFDSRSRVADVTLKDLLEMENIICLFDTNCLTNKQFETILLKASNIHQKKSNFIISINESDIDSINIMNLRAINKEIDTEKIQQISIPNKFNRDETKNINFLLPKLDILPFNHELTILDNSIKIEKSLEVKGRFSTANLEVNTFKELAFFIILATKEKIYSSELIMFGLETEAYYATKKYTPFIELTCTETAEKSFSDLSSQKYVLNAKYWLYRQLGAITSEKTNNDLVVQAYEYIINRILIKYSDNLSKQRNTYKKYILFDVINNIFLKDQHGQLPLIVSIYNRLHSQLANDYNFLHQNAKCFLKYALYRKKKEEKENYLRDALQKAKVSYAICEELCNKTSYQHLFISLAHIQFTIAIIYCQLCEFHKYYIREELNKTIDYIYAAVKNPYYLDIYRKDIKNQSIIYSVINKMIAMDLDKDANEKLNSIMGIILKNC